MREKGRANIVLERILEPEVMDTEEDAEEYEAIPNDDVNAAFAAHAVALSPGARDVLDIGTGPGHIAILVAKSHPSVRVTAIDLAESMLVRARRNLARSGVGDRVEVLRRDAKATRFSDASFDLVLSNSLVHHLPEPIAFFRELVRVSRAGAGLLVRDLLRPTSSAALEELVRVYADECSAYQRRLFADSLHASLTVAEVRGLCEEAGLEDVTVSQTSDRHWTLERRRRAPREDIISEQQTNANPHPPSGALRVHPL
jgi:ubiquinone/menaquinone biosynthesis C-methylase UbiE